MEKVSKRFEERCDIINRIRGSPRLSHPRNSTVEQPSSHELPPIVNSLPHIQREGPSPKMSTTITSQLKTSIEGELDSIINQTLSGFKNQKINKIIFTSPITNRLSRASYKINELPNCELGRVRHGVKRNTTVDIRRFQQCLDFAAGARNKDMENPYNPNFSTRLT
jgi:hypothetical protein